MSRAAHLRRKTYLRRRPPSKCYKTGYRVWPTALVASWYRYRLPRRGNVYVCTRCGFWHWTSGRHGRRWVRRPSRGQRKALARRRSQ